MARKLTGDPYIHPSDAPESGVGGRLRFRLATGQASGVDTSVPGMAPEDTIHSIEEHMFTGADIVDIRDRTADVQLIKLGAFQLSGAHASGNKLSVRWLDLK